MTMPAMTRPEVRDLARRILEIREEAIDLARVRLGLRTDVPGHLAAQLSPAELADMRGCLGAAFAED